MAVIVKFASEMSKKTLLAHLTFTRPDVVTWGTVIDSVPSFTVAAARTVGKVAPLSVDNVMLTRGS